MNLLSILLLASAGADTCPAIQPHIDALDRPARCHTMTMLAAWQAAEEAGETDCLAQALQERGLPHWAPVRTPLAPAPPPPFPGKQTRDLYDLPNSVESENFIVRWGDSGSVSQSNCEELLEIMETGWEYEVGVMEMPQPTTTETYKLNVYVGDTGGPSASGAAGYFSGDQEGYPMIVINKEYLPYREYVEGTAVHEFFHATQWATGAYADYGYGVSSWYWEATACWVEAEVWPDNPIYAIQLFGFAFIPHYALNFFDYPDTGALQEYHQYGAFIFPRYISEIAADWTVVRDAWTEGLPSGDVLDELEDQLEERGLELRSVWSDFIAHNATWDYEDGFYYEYFLDYYGDYMDDESIVNSLEGAGSQEWIEAGDPLPMRLGSNTILLEDADSGYLNVDFEGDVEGDEGDDAWWTVRLVIEDGNQVSYDEVPLKDTVGSLRTELPSGTDNVYLVVGASTDRSNLDEEFGYRYRMWVGDPIQPDDTGLPQDTGPGDVQEDTGGADEGKGGGKKGGCGCNGGAAAGLLGLPLVLAGLRRRRWNRA